MLTETKQLKRGYLVDQPELGLNMSVVVSKEDWDSDRMLVLFTNNRSMFLHPNEDINVLGVNFPPEKFDISDYK